MVTMLDIVPFPSILVPNAVILMSEKRLHFEEDTSRTSWHILCTQFDAGMLVELQTFPDRASVYIMV